MLRFNRYTLVKEDHLVNTDVLRQIGIIKMDGCGNATAVEKRRAIFFMDRDVHKWTGNRSI